RPRWRATVKLPASRMVELRRRGGTVIVVNPLKELGLVRFRIPSQTMSLLFGSNVSDIYIQPHIGTDVAVFKAILKGVIETDGADADFLRERVEGWEAVEEDVRSTSWETLLECCGVPRSQIDAAAAAISRANHGILLWAMGLTHHANGVDNIAALANIALARGWLGGRGRGLLPIRGHSNVQGVGSVGFTPALKEAFARKMEETYGIPSEPNGLDTYGSMLAAEEGRIRAAVLLGGNLWASNPDLDWAGDAMQKIGTTAHITTKLNLGHIHGRGKVNLLLPVLARDEEKQATTQESMFNFVRLSDGGAPPPTADIRSEVEVITALAARVLPPGPFPFEKMGDHRAIREVIADVVPGFEEIA
ncbi:MAG: molybdopterin-dependent oxidoreductase, partial [Acidobacteriota bacterium]|nr:molybdopterin-dependent oxidoreductase [Acidobacteriota bacterium]